MKTVAVFDVPASMGGALTILKSFYEYALKCSGIHWIFIVSTGELTNRDNVEVRQYPWVKKSWFHRLFFDMFTAPRIVKGIKPDAVFSLQNVCVKAAGIRQILYVHQPIPFTDTKFGFSESPVLWIYQNIISRSIYRSIKYASAVIVQTNWMKRKILEITGTADEKVSIIPPEYRIDVKKEYSDNENSRKCFFYPVSPNAYKNHGVILKAIKQLEAEGIRNFTVTFTCDPASVLDGIPVSDMKHLECIGKIPLEEVYRRLADSTLIFPSKIETFGLPMLEAACIKTRILAGDMPFSHDILDGYPNADFFEVDDYIQLSRLMKAIINNEKKYSYPPESWYEDKMKSSGWQAVVDMF